MPCHHGGRHGGRCDELQRKERVRCVSGVRFWERRCRIRESTEREEHWATRWHSTHVRTANAEMVRENKRVWVFHSSTQLLSTQLLCVRTAGAADQPSSRPLSHCDRGVDCGVRGTQAIAVSMTPKRRFILPPKTSAGKPGSRRATPSQRMLEAITSNLGLQSKAISSRVWARRARGAHCAEQACRGARTALRLHTLHLHRACSWRGGVR